MKKVLDIHNVSKSYEVEKRKLAAISSVDISIKKGEFVCIIGPNGCGKSTLLKLVAGILTPDSGNIEQFGQSAYLPQQPSLLPWRTAEGNLHLANDLRKKSARISTAKTRSLLTAFKMKKFAGFYPHELSGGMQQKIALLRMAMTEPDLMLLDEPFSALDAITRRELQRWLLDLWQKTNPAVMCVTHDVSEAIFLADTIYVLSKRPGTVTRKIAVNLPRPRRHDHLLSAEAKNLQKQINNLLENTG